MKLTNQQMDLMAEIFNQGVGKASASIEELAGCEVFLSVPEVSIVLLKDLIEVIKKKEGENISCVIQKYSGPFEGSAMMIYSEDSTLQLIQLIMGTETPLEQLNEMESDALGELGNIVLNSCLSVIGSILESEIETEIPYIISGSTENVLTLENQIPFDHEVIFLKMGFKISASELQGYISFLIDAEKIQVLLDQLDEYFKKILEG